MPYKINWDIEHACGTFPTVYDTEEAAQAAADDIFAENVAQDIWDEETCSVEVIEVEPEPTEDDAEEAAAADEQSLDYFNRYIAGDR